MTKPIRIPVLDGSGREVFGYRAPEPTLCADGAPWLTATGSKLDAHAARLNLMRWSGETDDRLRSRIDEYAAALGRIAAARRGQKAPTPTRKRPWKRRLVVAALFVPMVLWSWPRLIARDLAAGYRAGRDRR